jgi:hypothetical protein
MNKKWNTGKQQFTRTKLEFPRRNKKIFFTYIADEYIPDDKIQCHRDYFIKIQA